MRIPEHIIDQVRELADIVQIVEQSVTLKKRGRNYLGLCPFHNEKTPSFNVNAEGGFYKCFGCGKGGNVFNFVMDHYHLSFPEAVRHVAKIVHVDIPDGDANPELEKTIESVHAVLRNAQEFFADNLRSTPNVAATYIDQRGFSEEAVRVFGLGYSLPAWEECKTWCSKNGFEEKVQLDAGLLIEKEGGGTYDRFRGRLMFPIHSKSGRIIGYGARQLDNDKRQPKYINSPQTIVYDKSKVLYGLYQAKEAMREQGFAILTEGYADVISLWQHGVRNAIASSGTALTQQQVQIVKRTLSNSSNATQADVYVVYDSDSAGAKASMKAVSLMLQEGLDVRIVNLPEGEDPDSFVQKRGASGFLQQLSESQTYVQFAQTLLQRAGMWDNATAKRRALEQLLQHVASIKDALLRDQVLQEVATVFGFSRETLVEETQRIQQDREYKQQQKARYSTLAPPAVDYAPPIQGESPEPTSQQASKTVELELDSSERALLYSMVTDTRVQQYLERIGLRETDFLTETGSALFVALQGANKENWQSSIEQSTLSEAEKSAARAALQPPAEASKQWHQFEVEIQFNPRKFVDESIHTMKKRKLTELRLETRQKLSQTSDAEAQRTLIQRLQELTTQLASM